MESSFFIRSQQTFSVHFAVFQIHLVETKFVNCSLQTKILFHPWNGFRIFYLQLTNKFFLHPLHGVQFIPYSLLAD
jgi:hypothetical protein